MFKRRDRQPIWKRALRALWPKGGWGRAARYVQYRIHRLPDPPDRIARGIFAGVFVTFTPLYGLHFGIAALLAWILRGNIVAALLGTFFGNPLTYVPIGVISLKTGYWLLDMRPAVDPENSLGHVFMRASDDLWHNLTALVTGRGTDWDNLILFYHNVFYPYLIGGILPGIVVGLICYYISVPLIRAYQNRRKGSIARKLAQIKAKKKAADEAAGPH